MDRLRRIFRWIKDVLQDHFELIGGYAMGVIAGVTIMQFVAKKVSLVLAFSWWQIVLAAIVLFVWYFFLAFVMLCILCVVVFFGVIAYNYIHAKLTKIQLWYGKSKSWMKG